MQQSRHFLLYVKYCTRVYFLMFGQVIVAYEGFSAFITLVAFIVMVNSEVKSIEGTVCSDMTGLVSNT